MNVKKNEMQVIDLPKVFTFNPSNQPIRVEVINQEPYFVAKDVCDVLDLRDTEVSLRKLDDDEKLMRKVYASGQNREMWLINESGLYNLIFRSNKSEAKVFRKWVTSEVLPSLRKTGTYEIQSKTNQPLSVVDLRSIPYDTYLYNGVQVRGVEHNDVLWYSINDLNKSIGANTNAYQIAKMLNTNVILARKIHVFGGTRPAWFCTMRGVKLIISGSRINHGKKSIGSKQLELNLGGRN